MTQVVQQEEWVAWPSWGPGSWFEVAPHYCFALSPILIMSTVAKHRSYYQSHLSVASDQRYD